MTLGKQYFVGDFSLLTGGRKAKGGGGGGVGGAQRARKRAGGGGKGNKEVYSAKHVRIQQKKKEKSAG